MDVIKSTIYPIIEEVIAKDIVNFVKNNVINQVSFTIKSVPLGIDPAHIQTSVIGYYNYYGKVYLSDPHSEIGVGEINCENKEIILNNKKQAFFKQRDAYVYIQPQSIYVQGTYNEVLNEFIKNGYKLIHMPSQ